MCDLDEHDFKNFGDGIYRCINCHYVFDISAHIRHVDNIMDDGLKYNDNEASWEAIVQSASDDNDDVG